MAKKKYYAVVRGKTINIFTQWEDCEASIRGYSNAKHKGFSLIEEAVAWYEQNGGDMSLLSEEYLEACRPKTLPKIDISAVNCKDCKVMGREKLQEEQSRFAGKLQTKLEASRKSEDRIAFDEAFYEKYGFTHLSKAQKQAIETVKGKSLLFAVPGSGKTTVLIARVGYLLHGSHGMNIRPDMLVNLTFTKAAAKEMTDRYAQRFPEDVATERTPVFRTIHSFCYHEILPKLRNLGWNIPILLNMNEDSNQNAACTDLEDDFAEAGGATLPAESPVNHGNLLQYTVLKEVLRKFRLPYRDEVVRGKIEAVITSIKNRQLAVEEYQDKVLTIMKTPYPVKKIFDVYQNELKKSGYMDFDDMLNISLEGLRAFPRMLRELQERYSYWSIDEAQDNSKLQNSFLSLLVGATGNLFVVGDDDQSIYNFRGAEPRQLLVYGARDDAKAMVMDTNYRSEKDLVGAAQAFIKSNICRADKRMQPRQEASCGQIKFYTVLPTEQQQYRHIVKTAQECLHQGRSMAVSYRLNASGLPVMFWLKKYGISFKVYKEYKDIAAGKIFREIFNLMILAMQPDNFDAFQKCRYALGVLPTAETINDVREKKQRNSHVSNILDYLGELQGDLRPHIVRAKDMLQNIRRQTPFEAVRYILQNMNPSEESAVQRLREYAILGACIPYETIDDFLRAHFELEEDAVRDNQTDTGITLTSMHSAKGLEFDHVLIIDAWEAFMTNGLIQNADEFGYEDEEESRRLFYVAVTRAKGYLDVCMPESYLGNPEIASDFIGELAQCYEAVTGTPVRPLPEERGEIELPVSYVFQPPQKYYGVRVGKQTGVFDSWAETERMVKEYPNADYKMFLSVEEAEAYVEEQVSFRSDTLDGIMQNSPLTCMRAVDLPKILVCSVLKWFNVNSLEELPRERSKAIKKQGNGIFYSGCGETDYHGRVDYYILAYMLANYHKMWKPLWDMIKKRRLGNRLKILELGAGPGTSTLSLWHFFLLLAQDNPETEFALEYHVVEREPHFVEACRFFTQEFKKQQCATNLRVDIKLIPEDIFAFVEHVDDEQYDLILESNVLNGNENITQKKAEGLALSLINKLKGKGCMVLLEPGKEMDKEALIAIEKLVLPYDFVICEVPPRKSAVPLNGNSLWKSVEKLRVREKHLDSHWFSYAVFRKKGMSS